jgi:hypothetical protein
MKISIINEDKTVVVAEIPKQFDFELDASIWAIQWDGDSGHIEYLDRNEPLTDISQFQYLIDAHAAEPWPVEPS